MKTAYLDAFSGISGDMVLGAVIDAGVPLAHIKRELKKMELAGYALKTEKVKRGAISATSFKVTQTAAQKPRSFAQIKKLINKSRLNVEVKKMSLDIFSKLAAAEAKVHRTTPDKVHFHEVGAVDSIVDIVGAVVGFNKLGIKRFECSVIPTGSGFVKTSHGTLPIPAPATLLILKGIPINNGPAEFELTTPTGAAIVAALCSKFGSASLMSPSIIGHGAGKKSRKDGVPNLLRLVIGETPLPSKTLTVIETNIDDATPESLSYAMEKLMASGALDVWLAPVVMKKGRQAFKLSALCANANSAKLRKMILEETPTIGVRQYEVERFELEREIIKVKTVYGNVRVKRAVTPDGNTRLKPEADDCARLAKKHGVALKKIQSAAIHAALKRK